MTVDSGSFIAPTVPIAKPSLHTRPVPPPLPHPPLSQTERVTAGGFALLGCLVFAVAAILSPFDNDGLPLSHGTHRQLGLPPCAVKMLTGFPCPSCGMTTSISLVMHGDFVAASEANWAGLVVAGLGLITTAWLFSVAAGIPSGIFTVDNVIKWLTITGASTALVRWLALVTGSLPCP